MEETLQTASRWHVNQMDSLDLCVPERQSWWLLRVRVCDSEYRALHYCLNHWSPLSILLCLSSVLFLSPIFFSFLFTSDVSVTVTLPSCLLIFVLSFSLLTPAKAAFSHPLCLLEFLFSLFLTVALIITKFWSENYYGLGSLWVAGCKADQVRKQMCSYFLINNYRSC